MILSKQNLKNIDDQGVSKPDEKIFDLPVKVLQFGTGVLLRGLPDYFIDQANRQGIFNGRIVVVKSTASGAADAFDEQDGLYTLIEKGIERGRKVENEMICAGISHVLSALSDWDKVLREATNPHLKVIISNTTEVGITLVEETIDQNPPFSFPAKLLALLYKRYQVFNGSTDSGLVIIPTELLPDNGAILKSILIKLIQFNQLGTDFETWVNTANHFCNSLVDRIVPGKPAEPDLLELEEKMQYRDNLLIVSEIYRLWAIEGDEKIRSVLDFEKADSGVIIAPDINIYRELKLRLLNGTHTLSCALAFLSGFDTVKSAVDDDQFQGFVRRLMTEISTAIPYSVNQLEAVIFSLKVLDRFRNPHIRHLWISISQQYTTKLKMRVIPVLIEYYRKFSAVPLNIAAGLAAYLYFMRVVKHTGDNYFGEYKGTEYPVVDDKARVFLEIWQQTESSVIAATVLKNITLWDADLTALPGFAEKVQEYLDLILSGNITKVVIKQY